ncbi:MAG: hypothetical protein MK202_15910 [Tenacibaculum sp.]|nr:hypothetical protein [Tenacibaculum sp.]
MNKLKSIRLIKTLILLGFSFILLSCNNDKTVISDLDALSIKILSPKNTQVIKHNENLEFQGQISSSTITDFSNYNVEWSSDIDGVLYQGKTNSNGFNSFSYSNLSKNIHYIRFTLSNEIDEVIYDESVIYNSIWLHPITDENSSAHLKWSKTNDSNFESYQLYRSNNKFNLENKTEELIYTSTNPQDTTFFDKQAFLGQKHYYKVFLKRKNVAPTYVGSNIDSITLGRFVNVDYPILKLAQHPNKPYIYGIVNTEDTFNSNITGYGIVLINTETKNVEKRFLTNIRFSDLDIQGNYLYLASRSNIIHKIDLEKNQLESTFSLARSAHKIEIGSNNRLYYHITPPTSGATEFRMYDLLNGNDIVYSSTISDAYSSFRHGDFELDINNTIYHGESNSSNPGLSKITTINDTFGLAKQISIGDYQNPVIILNNDKLYWNHLLYDTNLNFLGSFLDDNQEIEIETITPNGEYALGLRRLFKTENLTVSRYIPVIYEVSHFVDNSNLILINNEKKDASQYQSTIYFYNVE